MNANINLAFLSLLLFMVSCETEFIKTEIFTVKNTDFTACLDNSKKLESNISSLSMQAIKDNYLKIQHHNTMFCCGTENVEINCEIRNDSIFIEEIDLGPYTYCYCLHDLEFEIGPLNKSNYTLQLIGCETSYDRDTILLNFQYTNDFYYTDSN